MASPLIFYKLHRWLVDGRTVSPLTHETHTTHAQAWTHAHHTNRAIVWLSGADCLVAGFGWLFAFPARQYEPSEVRPDRLGQLRYSLQRSKALAKACKVSGGGSSWLNIWGLLMALPHYYHPHHNLQYQTHAPAYLDLLIIRRWQVVASVPVFTYRQLTRHLQKLVSWDKADS